MHSGVNTGSDETFAAPVFASQLGGRAEEQARAITTDALGYLYLAGWTRSRDFPTTAEAFDDHVDGRDAFVVKMSPDGEELIWSTVLGGARDEEALAITIDAAGLVLVGGWTNSNDFPIVIGAHRPERTGHRDGFLTALDPSGGRLVFSTHVGGSADDAVTGIALSPEGDIILTGWTESRDLPTTPTSVQPDLGGRRDAFFMRLDEQAKRMRFVSYLGGRAGDQAVGLALDATGNMLLAGTTESRDFPVTFGAFDETKNGKDVFVTRVSGDGERLTFSTFYGGSHDEVATAFAVAPDGGVLVVGNTRSKDLPIKGAEGHERPGGLDGFVVHFANSGGALIFSRYLGGQYADSLEGLTVDTLGGIWVSGRTNSNEMASGFSGAQTQRGGADDGLLLRLDGVTGAVEYGTYVGGKGFENLVALAPDRVNGGVAFAGLARLTEKDDRGRFSGRGGAENAFVGRLVPGDCGTLAVAIPLGQVNGMPLDADLPHLGRTTTLRLSACPPNTPGLLYLGASMPTYLTHEEIGNIYIDLSSIALLSTFTTDANGAMSLDLPLPSNPNLCGLRVVVQGFINHRVTGAMELVLGS